MPTNGSLDLVTGTPVVPPQSLPSDRTAQTFLNGTFGSLNGNNTANTTEIAAMAIWHVLQAFLGAFPQLNPPPNSSVGVNLFAESYGGRYGPVFAELWEEQNWRRRNGTLSNSAVLDIQLKALGIMNGCVDDAVQGPYYTHMMANNTYGLYLLSPVSAALNNASFYQSGGCLDLTTQCRNATSALDPDNQGRVSGVNTACEQATIACTTELLNPYADSGRSFYDIAHLTPESFPPSYYIEYLNSQDVQAAIGSRVNYSDVSGQVYQAFQTTGDWERGPIVPKLAALVEKGVRVGLVYGDRDFICNWLGGEAVSMSIASSIGGSYAANFPEAGYAPIIVNDSYIGGVVRQFGNLSFSRIFQSGHFVPAYQPETAFQVFARIILGTSVSSGASIDLSTFNTTGPPNATSSLSLPPSPIATCYLRSLNKSCPAETVSRILQGHGVVINGVWYAASSDWPGAAATTMSSQSSNPASTTPASLTGFFIATSTPKASCSMGSRHHSFALSCIAWIMTTSLTARSRGC